jgi:hypothetical protein
MASPTNAAAERCGGNGQIQAGGEQTKVPIIQGNYLARPALCVVERKEVGASSQVQRGYA